MGKDKSMIREAVGIFHSAADMEAAIEDLQEHGFNRAEISLLASQDTVRDKLGHHYTESSELEDDPAAPRTAFVSTESVGDAEGAFIGGLMYAGALAVAGTVVASGGSFGAILAGAVAGGGSASLIGGMLATLLGEQHAHNIEQQLQRGGLLVWARTRDEHHEKSAVDILKRNNASDVHLHTIEA